MTESLSNIFESSEPTLLTSGWGRAEGPLWHPKGYVTFVDLEGNRLLRWEPNGSVTVVRENTGEGNGCTLDRQGRLIMCEGADHRRITRMEADGTFTTIAERWQGKRFNKPNDVVCRSDGSIYFTDPGLRLPAELREIPFSGVFRIDPAGRVHLATDECEYPNGIAFFPDESILYVAISRLDERCFGEAERGAVCTHRRIRAFDVAAKSKGKGSPRPIVLSPPAIGIVQRRLLDVLQSKPAIKKFLDVLSSLGAITRRGAPDAINATVEAFKNGATH